MSFFSRHIDHLLQMGWQTIAALALICAVAAFFIKDCLAHPPVVLYAYPFLLIFSIPSPYVFERAELFTPKKLDPWLTWTLLVSTWGTLIARACWPPLSWVRDRSGNHRV
jgi:hypothetical protein